MYYWRRSMDSIFSDITWIILTHMSVIDSPICAQKIMLTCIQNCKPRMTKSKRISAMRKNIISSLFELTSFHKSIFLKLALKQILFGQRLNILTFKNQLWIHANHLQQHYYDNCKRKIIRGVLVFQLSFFFSKNCFRVIKVMQFL